MNSSLKDLVILCACKDGMYAIQGLLSRPEALGIRGIEYELFIHIERDPGCLGHAHEFLRPMTDKYQYALIVFDRSGCGREAKSREELEQEVKDKLSQSGWNNRGDVIVIDPELDVWVWSDSPEVDRCLGWQKMQPGLRDWIKQHNKPLWKDDTDKPQQPKEAMQEALRHVRKPRSSAIYKKLAENVSVDRCVDPAFSKFRSTLTKWFPIEPQEENE